MNQGPAISTYLAGARQPQRPEDNTRIIGQPAAGPNERPHLPRPPGHPAPVQQRGMSPQGPPAPLGPAAPFGHPPAPSPLQINTGSPIQQQLAALLVQSEAPVTPGADTTPTVYDQQQPAPEQAPQPDLEQQKTRALHDFLLARLPHAT